jgi:anthranilate synthase component II
MKVLVLDNYDSFTWNLVHGLEAAGGNCIVHRSDAISLEQVAELSPNRIVISPGPFGPDQTGISRAVVGRYGSEVPILGVCLGMQVIAACAGARLKPSGRPLHGKSRLVWHDGNGLLRGLPNPFEAARYHSLIVEPQSVPDEMKISAWDAEQTILGCRIAGSTAEGVLFHPESFLTPFGPQILANFLEA